MYVVIQQPNQIRTAQEKLLRKLHAVLPLFGEVVTIGYQGGNFDFDELRSNGRIWFAHNVDRQSRIHRNWNAFGLASELKLRGPNKITAEANVCLDGQSKMVAGRFIKDEKSGNIMLVHTGKIGGGKKGVGKSAFLSWYKGKTIEYAYATKKATKHHGIVVADLDSDVVAEQIEDFVRAVHLFTRNDDERAAEDLSDDELQKKADRAAGKPKSTTISSISFVRDACVAAYAKRRAKGKCELCMKPAPFESAGKPYLECHHILWLAHGGHDSRDNTVALCPNCHRKMHVMKDLKDIATLKKRAQVTL